MNQYQWTFLDDERYRHTLGIAHSPVSGHLVVHCDQRVMLIDFSVLKPRTFTFFVGNELCRLNILGTQEDGFTYDFQIDTEVDTEVNRQRKAAQRRDNRKGVVRILGAAALAALIIGSVILWGFLTNRQNEYLGLINKEGVRAVAQIDDNGELEFVAGSRIIRGMPIDRDVDVLTALNLPARSKIQVLFHPNSPNYFMLDWAAILAVDPRVDRSMSTVQEQIVMRLEDNLPESAGDGACALIAASKYAGKVSQQELVFAYLFDQESDLWENRFGSDRYRDYLRKVCPN